MTIVTTLCEVSGFLGNVVCSSSFGLSSVKKQKFNQVSVPGVTEKIRSHSIRNQGAIFVTIARCLVPAQKHLAIFVAYCHSGVSCYAVLLSE